MVRHASGFTGSGELAPGGLGLANEDGLFCMNGTTTWELAKSGGLLPKLSVSLIAETLIVDNRRY
jgi:hypothetical protein